MTSTRPSSRSLVALSVAALTLAGAVGCSAPPESVSEGPISVAAPSVAGGGKGTNVGVPDGPPGEPGGGRRGALGVDDGRLPDGATAFDDQYPGIANLSPDLLGALRSAAEEARRDGVSIELNSGWRSADYQEQLLEDAVSQYGSRAKAARWVATPETSPHVSGQAVDVDGSRATEWLADHGEDFGLCRVFRNEPWHFELRAEAAEEGCPRQYTDPTHDPRMQR